MERLQKHLTDGLIICLVLAATGLTLPAVANFRLSPEMILEDSLSYSQCSTPLDNRNKDSFPYNGFIVIVNYNEPAQLQTSCFRSKEYPRPNLPEKFSSTYAGVIEDWTTRTTFLKPGKGWTQLTFAEAKALWGKPREHSVEYKDFYTFDAHSTHNDVENIYHLDLSFDGRGVIDGYRVRGIGIRSLEWVKKSPASNMAPEQKTAPVENFPPPPTRVCEKQ